MGQMPTRCYVEYLQTLLADYVRSKGVEGILAPHPEGHVGIFASPTEKVRCSPISCVCVPRPPPPTSH